MNASAAEVPSSTMMPAITPSTTSANWYSRSVGPRNVTSQTIARARLESMSRVPVESAIRSVAKARATPSASAETRVTRSMRASERKPCRSVTNTSPRVPLSED